jgi:hypothetical protein
MFRLKMQHKDLYTGRRRPVSLGLIPTMCVEPRGETLRFRFRKLADFSLLQPHRAGHYKQCRTKGYELRRGGGGRSALIHTQLWLYSGSTGWKSFPLITRGWMQVYYYTIIQRHILEGKFISWYPFLPILISVGQYL